MTQLPVEAIPEKPRIINFFGFEKRLDWRYRTYNLLRLNRLKPEASQEKTVHWIGIIDLEKIRENKTHYPISFFNDKMVPDAESNRDVDGADLPGQTVYNYDLSEILPDLLKHRAAGKKYFHVFLEETVDWSGNHEVALLYDKESKYLYGLETVKPWFEEPAKNWIQLSAFEEDSALSRITILNHSAYRWMK